MVDYSDVSHVDSFIMQISTRNAISKTRSKGARPTATFYQEFIYIARLYRHGLRYWAAGRGGWPHHRPYGQPYGLWPTSCKASNMDQSQRCGVCKGARRSTLG